jgi:hypothetical protein
MKKPTKHAGLLGEVFDPELLKRMFYRVTARFVSLHSLIQPFV